MLPPETRAMLVERYVHDASHPEVAARHGVSEDAVKKRVERGKAVLKRVLSEELGGEIQAFGIAPPRQLWQETRLWCPTCGRRRLDPSSAGAPQAS